MSEHPHIGTAAEEAAKLFSAVEHWARTRGGRLFDDEHLATGSPECQSCPICQGLGLLRQVRPETVEHLLEATSSLVAALKAALLGPSGSAAAPASSKVEHIEVQGEDEWR